MHSAKTDIFMPAGQTQTLTNVEQKKMKQHSVQNKGALPKAQIKYRCEGLLEIQRTPLLIWDHKLRGKKCILGHLWKDKYSRMNLNKKMTGFVGYK